MALAALEQRDRVREGNVLHILGWIIFGAIVGLVAKLLHPGRDPGGFIVTILIGIAGSLLGGFLGRVIGIYHQNEAAGLILSVIGAIILLVIYHAVAFRRAA
jgi:uncharacterized membrane protein YeaQ/YmgE (transglycosylase-associated protein family)